MGGPTARPKKRAAGSGVADERKRPSHSPRSLAYDHAPAADDPLLTAYEVSVFTGVPEKTLGEWRYHGIHLPYHKLGHSVRYRRADVEAWVDANRNEVDPEGLLTTRQRAAAVRHTEALREFFEAHPELTALEFLLAGGLAGFDDAADAAERAQESRLDG